MTNIWISLWHSPGGSINLEGMVTIIQETEEEKEEKRREAARRRAKMLIGVCVLVVLARIFIKNPEPPKLKTYNESDIQYLPGTLEAMPESTRAKLTPQQLARYQEADERALSGSDAFGDAWVQVPYVPQEAPPEITEDIEAYRNQVFQYAKKRKRIEIERKEMDIDYSKKMLVLFKHGRHLKAKDAYRKKKRVGIMVDKTMMVRLPTRWVRSISDNALTWKEPIRKGYVEIKPARGITMIVSRKTSKRIRIRKNIYHEG